MRKVLALTLTSLLGACQLAPPHARPALPTAQDYPTSYAGDVVLGRRAVEISWREFFADPQLETFVATALERNRDQIGRESWRERWVQDVSFSVGTDSLKKKKSKIRKNK